MPSSLCKKAQVTPQPNDRFVEPNYPRTDLVRVPPDVEGRAAAQGQLAARGTKILERYFTNPFAIYDPQTGALNPPSGLDTAAVLAFPWLKPQAKRCLQDGRGWVQTISPLLQVLLIPLQAGNRGELVAIGFFGTRMLDATEIPSDLKPWLQPRDGHQNVCYCQPELLRQLGNGVVAALKEQLHLAHRELELKQMAAQLSRNYEEITLLHQLTREAQVSQGVRSLQEMTLSLLADMIPARQVAYVPAQRDSVLSQGQIVVEGDQCFELIRLLGREVATSVRVDNHLGERADTQGNRQFAELGRLISVPVMEDNEQFGWLLALSRTEDPELGSVEASLMTAIAAILATHQTNVRLYRNIKDLFLGVVRALSSAIDAKDPYTCGHSERVARLAHRIAQRMGLPAEQQNKIYLSGLLHDVGKIGIRDSVLLKPGRLTDEELAHMKRHPTIGYDILCGVRQLQSVLSGVRSHHENVDGTGYPDGLRGEAISLMARVVAVADSYDAMGSDRPYRTGLTKQQISAIFRQGAGRQWDEAVVNVMIDILNEQMPDMESDTARHTDSSNQNGPMPTQVFDAIDIARMSQSNFEYA